MDKGGTTNCHITYSFLKNYREVNNHSKEKIASIKRMPLSAQDFSLRQKSDVSTCNHNLILSFTEAHFATIEQLYRYQVKYLQLVYLAADTDCLSNSCFSPRNIPEQG